MDCSDKRFLACSAKAAADVISILIRDREDQKKTFLYIYDSAEARYRSSKVMSEARRSLTTWLEQRRGTTQDFLFSSRVDYLGHLSTRQYARLVDEWVSTVDLDHREYGTHSLRRTKAALIYRATGNLRAGQILLQQTNIENTVP